MQNKFAMHCFVSGLVQGVWFRAGTEAEAKRLGLTGWIRNLSDGRVEVIACGDEPQVMKLFVWLKKGPPHAKVRDVTFEVIDWQEHSGFIIT